MAPKRNIDTPDTKSNPKKTKRLIKAYKLFNSDNIQLLVKLIKACRNRNLEIVRQILKTIKISEINQRITPKEIQEKKLLHIASKIGSVEILEELLKYNIDIDDTNSRGKTALHVATQSGHAKIVAILLAYGADVNFQLNMVSSNQEIGYNGSKSDTRALHIAARNGYHEVLQELLKYDVDIDVRNLETETALHLASDRGHATIVAQLLEHGANVHLFSVQSNIVSNKALHIACRKGYSKIVKELLKHDKEIDSKNEVGETPLHKASVNGWTKIVKELLDHGARIDLHVGSDPEGCIGLNCNRYCYPDGNALHLAIKSGNVKTVQLLLDQGLTLDKTCSSNYFIDACEYGNLNVVKELIRRGVNIHEQFDYEQKLSPLHVAISYGRIEVVKELLRLGVDVNLDDEYYGTPLNVATVDGHLEIVKLLLKHGANPYQKLEDHDTFDRYLEQDTPLENAVAKEHDAIVQELLLYGDADAIVDERKWTPLHYSSSYGNLVAVRKHLASGCDINMKTDNNSTPLHSAVEYALVYGKSVDVVLHLLHHGADLNSQDVEGNTPLHNALMLLDEPSQYEMEVFQMILENGKDIDFAIKNEESKTVLQMSIDKKYNEVTKMIAKKMCPKSRITFSIYPLQSFMKNIQLKNFTTMKNIS